MKEMSYSEDVMVVVTTEAEPVIQIMLTQMATASVVAGNTMSARERLPDESRTIQAPGMMRDGPYPGAHSPTRPHHPLDALPPLELLENKVASQSAEIERILMENRRLAATNVDMRKELAIDQMEIERIQSHIRSSQTERDIKVRGLLEKIRMMEDDVRVGEVVNQDLKQAHIEAQIIISEREELTREIQLRTEELRKMSIDIQRSPELFSELDGLRQEHKKIRAVFEYEKGSNMEQVEQMRTMEMNMLSMSREIEKLRADIAAVEKGERAAIPHATHPSQVPLYPSAGPGRLQPLGGPRYPDGYMMRAESGAGYSDSPNNPAGGSS